MSETLGMMATALLLVAANYATLFLIFPCKLKLRDSILLTICYVAIFYLLLIKAGVMGNTLGGLRGLMHLPLMLLLFRGQFFQKVFSYCFVFIVSGLLYLPVKTAAGYFASSPNYYTYLFLFALIIYSVYILVLFKVGRRFFQRLFVSGNHFEWAMYSLGGALSVALYAIFSMYPTSTWQQLMVYLFILWSFVLLCFSIINTHEKSKQRFDAEFAREVISSGREHYQKIDELHDTLRTLRHDYKYHLIAIDEYLSDDNKDELRQYLDGMKTQLSDSEIQTFCTNSVVNALLVRYAERCAKSQIAFTADIDLPDALSVPNYDLCIMVGNLLENAVEACQKQRDSGSIEIILKPLGQQLALRVKNSYEGQVYEKDGQLKSMKKDGGFGLRSIEAVAARYDGELLLDWQDGVFLAYVTMRL